jgi:hypothetical protein
MQIRKHSVPKRRLNGAGQVVEGGTAVIASAALVRTSDIARVGKITEWQKQAWDYYDTVSELRYGVTWLANALSRVRLYVGRIAPDGSSDPKPVEEERLIAPLNELWDGQVGQNEMLRRMTIHLLVPGESYLVGFDAPGGEGAQGARRWLTVAKEEIDVKSGGKVRVRDPDNDQWITLALDSSVVIRVWRPHPRRAFQADSPVLPLRSALAELQGMSQHILASLDSRLAGNGIVLVSDEVTMPAPTESEGPNPVHPDPLMAALIEGMLTPLQDRESAAAVVPLLLRAPGKVQDAMTHLTFSTPLDEKALVIRESAIRRVATGLDIPGEILTGLGESNHWSAWQISDEAIQLHVEPLAGLLCQALTAQYLRPALTAMGVPDMQDYCLWYDASALKQRPNRGPEALQAYGEGLLSAEATRRELGWGDEDAPGEEEAARLLLIKLAGAHGQLAPRLLPLLGVELPEDPEPQQPTPVPGAPAVPQGQAPAELPAGPSGRPEPPQATGAGGQQAALTAAGEPDRWLLSCLEMATLRALERAGQWTLNKSGRAYRGQLRDVPLHEIHTRLTVPAEQLDTVLAGAYRELLQAVPDAPCIHATVDSYVRALLLAGEPHQRGYLERALAQAGCVPDAA